MDISIGTLTPEIFAGLRDACDMPQLEPELMKLAIDNSLFTLCAVSGQRTVGAVRMVGDGAFVFVIVDLIVVPLWRRQGIGSKLVEEAIRRARASVDRSIAVSLFSVEGRESFYTRLGFTELPAAGLGAGMQFFCR